MRSQRSASPAILIVGDVPRAAAAGSPDRPALAA